MNSEKKLTKYNNAESDLNNLINNDEENLRIEVEKFILGAEEAMKNNEMGPDAELKLKEKQKAGEILFREIINDRNYDNLLSFIFKKVFISNFKNFFFLEKVFSFFRLKILQIMKSCKFSSQI